MLVVDQAVLVVKELNKASGVWSLSDQLEAVEDGTWPKPSVVTNYMVIAGGGSGANGGGGSGGYRASGFGPSPLRGSSLSLFPGDYTITVGGGATGQPDLSTAGPNGNPSSFFGIVSTGGGGGAFGSTAGGSGGSGGGDSGGPQAPTPGGGGQGGTGSSPGTNGGTNTGSGGGGTRDELGNSSGSNGGPGFVVARFPGSTNASVAPGTNSLATLPAPAGGCKVASFTVSGTLTIS